MRKNARGSLAKRVVRRAIMTSFGVLAALSFDSTKGSLPHTLLAHQPVYSCAPFPILFAVSPRSPRTRLRINENLSFVLFSRGMPLQNSSYQTIPLTHTIITIPPAHLLWRPWTHRTISEHGPTHILIFITGSNRSRMCDSRERALFPVSSFWIDPFRLLDAWTTKRRLI